MRLHQRHVLIRRRMIHRLGTVLAKDFFEAPRVLNAPDLRMEDDTWKARTQFPVNFVQRCLGVVETYQRSRLKARDLAAQFAPDRASGSCHQDYTTFEAGLNAA